MKTMPTLSILMILTLGAMLFSGCTSGTNGQSGPDASAPKSVRNGHVSQARQSGWDEMVAGEWPFAPVRFRIHPLTRVQHVVGGDYVVDARIEFFDQFGHNVKGLGEVRFELYPVEPGAGTVSRVGRMAVWLVDISDIEQNRLHYDDVTRTYLFRLQSEEGAVWPRAMQLQATMTMNGGRIVDTFTIEE